MSELAGIYNARFVDNPEWKSLAWFDARIAEYKRSLKCLERIVETTQARLDELEADAAILRHAMMEDEKTEKAHG